jgi:hypothetical protein
VNMFFFCLSKKQKQEKYLKKLKTLIKSIIINAHARVDLQETQIQTIGDLSNNHKFRTKLLKSYYKMTKKVLKIDKSILN